MNFGVRRLSLAVTVLMCCAGAAVQAPAAAVAAQEDASKPAYFDTQVKPVLQNNCYRCHGGANHRGGYSMNTRESLLKGSHHAPAVIPGKPAESMLVKLVRHEGPADDPMPMPPAPKPKISDAEIAVLEKWIKAGAITSDDPIFAATAP